MTTQAHHTPYDETITELEKMSPRPLVKEAIRIKQDQREGYLVAKAEDAGLLAVCEALANLPDPDLVGPVVALQRQARIVVAKVTGWTP